MRVDEDVYCAGTLRAKTLVPSAGCVSNSHAAADAAFAATKLEHQHTLTYRQDDGTDIAAAIAPLWTVRGATATIVAIHVVCIDAPEGGDKHFTVDLKKANEGAPSPATVLTAVIDSDTYGAGVNEAADCEVGVGSIASASLVAEDTLVLAIAIAGSTGNQGQGLIVTVTVREDAT